MFSVLWRLCLLLFVLCQSAGDQEVAQIRVEEESKNQVYDALCDVFT